MSDYLKSYEVYIDVKTPLYIGSGKTINKKEFIYDRNKKLLSIIDLEKLSLVLYEKDLFDSYTDYMTGRDNNLYIWLKDNGFTKREIDDIIDYRLSCNGFIEKKYTINTFVKDAYKCPYIPGSSLKGCLRTILLGYEFSKNPQKYHPFANEIEKLESKVFNMNYGNTECNIMSGLIISDSEPNTTDNLTLCQKYDKGIDSKGKNLPIYFEALRPYTKLSTTITINTRIFKYDIDYIREAINSFAQNYYDSYLSNFKSIKKRPDSGTIWLGGNSGFATKTVLYNLFDKKEALRHISKILENNFDKNNAYRIAKKNLDKKLKKEEVWQLVEIILKNRFDENRASQLACESLGNQFSKKEVFKFVSEILKKHWHREDFEIGVSPKMLNCCLFEGGEPPMGEAILSFKKI